MKNFLTLVILFLGISCQSTPSIATTSKIDKQKSRIKIKPQPMEAGSYTLVVEGYDWGAGASRVILPLTETIDKVSKDHYRIRVKKQAECKGEKAAPTTGERTILYAYVSDELGDRVLKGKYVTLVLLVAPNLDISSPMQYVGSCRRNVWADYKMTITDSTSRRVWNKETNRIHPLVDEFDLTGKFTHNEDITLTYADFKPPTNQNKVPLIIWLHGGGEGGTDPTIPLMANRAANYASPEIQAHFSAAYVLVPQAPSFWMDKGDGTYTRGDVDDQYNKSLMALIEDYVKTNSNIDEDRIYIGGCSNGGYMSLKLMFNHPNYFAASFPSALAYHNKFISEEQIQSIVDMPIWFIHSKDDPVTKADETVVPVYQRLMAAGAKNVHFSFYDHVIDVSGFYGGKDFYYMGHFSWIYSHVNDCKLDFDGKAVMMNGEATTVMEWLAGQRKF